MELMFSGDQGGGVNKGTVKNMSCYLERIERG